MRELRNGLAPSLEIVLGALTLDMVEYDALCIHQAVSGIAIDDKTLVNILISRDPVVSSSCLSDQAPTGDRPES